MLTLEPLCWPVARLGEGLEVLAARSGLAGTELDAVAVPGDVVAGNPLALERWLCWVAARCGIDLESVQIGAADVAAMVARAAPAIVRIRGGSGAGFLLVLRSGPRTLSVIGPDLRVRRCATAEVLAALTDRLARPVVAEIDRVLESTGLSTRQRIRAKRRLLDERLAAEVIGDCWILRLAPTTGFWRQLAFARLPHRLGTMLALFAFVYALEIAGWRVMGEAAIDGRLDAGWLAAWVLLLLSVIPLRLFAGWLDASFALDVGRLLKQRLLAGALAMDLDHIKRQGSGQLLGRVMESQALESLALNGGMGLLVALVEFGFAGWILSQGAAPALHPLLLVAWIVVSCWLVRVHWRGLRSWTTVRLGLTHDLVERMVGHRTTVAQEPPARRDRDDDRTMSRYLATSRALDASVTPLAAGIPGGWMFVGLLGLAPSFVSGEASQTGLAIGLAGVLLAARAFAGLAGGLGVLARAMIAWQQVGALFHAADGKATRAGWFEGSDARAGDVAGRGDAGDGDAGDGDAGDGDPSPVPADGRARPVLLDASGVVYRYPGASTDTLGSVAIRIAHGERILLEGASGGGKSTLAAILTGLRTADAGVVLLDGLDRATLGAAWHGRATGAPQFHENHVFSGTLGFNLLMGRGWPASEHDLEAARELCEELGLGELLERMPSGLMQMVGETGWQLSHGERSRIFLARALLQDAPLTIMDESFAALDPQTLRRCLHCAMQRAGTLMVIAHP
ncbi:MAG: ATP-binding cassette domain-containing protein [Lautropia sp.]